MPVLLGLPRCHLLLMALGSERHELPLQKLRLGRGNDLWQSGTCPQGSPEQLPTGGAGGEAWQVSLGLRGGTDAFGAGGGCPEGSQGESRQGWAQRAERGPAHPAACGAGDGRLC